MGNKVNEGNSILMRALLNPKGKSKYIYSAISFTFVVLLTVLLYLVPDYYFLERITNNTVFGILEIYQYDVVFDGYHPETMSICLTNAIDDKENVISKMILTGNNVAQMYATEKPFDLRALADRLEKVFPRMVKLYEDVGVILVMDKIRVNETGILEGTGPIAERVQRVYTEFIRSNRTS